MAETFEEYGPSADRAEELPWEEKHEVVEEAVNKLGGRIRHCFRNAFVHLRRSWRLHPIDSEMSLFRAITAEEEAATALILALKQRNYPGAKRLVPWEHSHKAAISPFLDAVGNLLVETNCPTPKLSIDRGPRPKLSLSLDMAALTGQQTPEFATFDNPLNYVLTVGDGRRVHQFEAQLQELANQRGETSIQQLVRNEANLRNKLLYAADDGIPNVRLNDSVILRRRDRVYRLALIAIAILQTKQHQLFAVQCLESYLAVIERPVDTELPLAQLAQPDGFRTTVVQQPDGSYSATTSYRVSSKVKISGQWLEYPFAWES